MCLLWQVLGGLQAPKRAWDADPPGGAHCQPAEAEGEVERRQQKPTAGSAQDAGWLEEAQEPLCATTQSWGFSPQLLFHGDNHRCCSYHLECASLALPLAAYRVQPKRHLRQ